MRNTIFTLLAVATGLVLIQFFYDDKDILLPWAGAFSLISVAIGCLVTLEQLRLKFQSQKVEADIKLMSHFMEIMKTAHARSGYEVSEKIVENLISQGLLNDIQQMDIPQIKQMQDKIEAAAILTLPAGVAQQDAAIASIAILGLRHDVLRPVAIEALEVLKLFKGNVANKYLSVLMRPTQVSYCRCEHDSCFEDF